MKISIPDVLKFAGFAVVLAACYFIKGNEFRIPTFVGAGLLAAGYFWGKLVKA